MPLLKANLFIKRSTVSIEPKQLLSDTPFVFQSECPYFNYLLIIT